MKAPMLLAAAAAACGFAGAAHAAGPPNAADCFLSRDWRDWSAPNDHTLYLRVANKDYWRIDLQGSTPQITDPLNHLISDNRDGSWICTPLDLQLKVSDGRIATPLFVKSLVKLTPEEAARIPSKEKP